MCKGHFLLGLAAWWCLFAFQVQADPIVLYNTGYQLSAGTHDPWYDITAGPGAPRDVYVVQTGGFPFPLWIPNFGTAQWVAPHDDYRSGNTDPAGAYWFQTTFDLTGLSPSTASITGEWASDNCGEIYLNGAATGQTTGTSPNCLAVRHSFTLTTGFVAGTNTLAFRVVNLPGDTGNPTGIIVSLSGTADQVPEPATLGLLSSGLLGLWLLRRRGPRA